MPILISRITGQRVEAPDHNRLVSAILDQRMNLSTNYMTPITTHGDGSDNAYKGIRANNLSGVYDCVWDNTSQRWGQYVSSTFTAFALSSDVVSVATADYLVHTSGVSATLPNAVTTSGLTVSSLWITGQAASPAKIYLGRPRVFGIASGVPDEVYIGGVMKRHSNMPSGEDAVGVDYVLRAVTMDGTPTDMAIDAIAPGSGSQYMVLDSEGAAVYSISVLAYGATGVNGGKVGTWQVTALLKRDAAAEVTQVGEQVTLYEEGDFVAGDWSVSVLADNTKKGANIQVTGGATDTVTWMAWIRATEVYV